MILGQYSGFLAPRFGALAVVAGIPVLGHTFGLPYLGLRPAAAPHLIKLQGLFNCAPIHRRWESMDPAELLTRAARYRALAARITDEQARAGLLELAEKYEALAQETLAKDPKPRSE